MVASVSNFYGETWVGFSLKIQKSSQFKANRKSVFLLKNGARDFQNSLLFDRSACFLCDNQWKFQMFSILQLWNKFSGKRKPFSKNWSTIF